MADWLYKRMNEAVKVMQERETDVTWTEVSYGMEALRILYDHYVDNGEMDKAHAINKAYFILEDFSKDSDWIQKEIA